MACLCLTDLMQLAMFVLLQSHVTIMSQTGPITMSCSGDQPRLQTCLSISPIASREMSRYSDKSSEVDSDRRN